MASKAGEQMLTAAHESTEVERAGQIPGNPGPLSFAEDMRIRMNIADSILFQPLYCQQTDSPFA